MVVFCKNTIGQTLQNWIEEHHYQNYIIITDENTHQHCLPKLGKIVHHALEIIVPAGEIHKNIETCQQIWHQLTTHQIDRKAICINLGGGVIGDMGGFCVATYKRGLDFVQIPTTLLSQVDASVGGKLGVDFEGFKNQIGVFKEPQAVFIDTAFLETLSQKEMLSGFAEIIKHCLIADKEVWSNIFQKDFDNQDIDFLVKHSVKIKEGIVAQDPHEKNIRKLLNFGHTIGHALESYFLDSPTPLLHGEAVAWGMIAESWIAYKLGYISQGILVEIESFIRKNYVKPSLKEAMIEKIAELSLHDKKNEQGKYRFTLLKALGEGIFDVEVEGQRVKESLYYLCAMQ